MEGDKKRKKDARNIIAQTRVNNSRYAWREENYENDEKEMGALCFTRRVLISHKYRGSCVAFSISKNVEPNEELKVG
jgi:hypothetical protein